MSDIEICHTFYTCIRKKWFVEGIAPYTVDLWAYSSLIESTISSS